MTSSQPVTFLQAMLWLVLILVLVGLFVVAVTSGMPAHLIIIVCLGLTRLFRSLNQDEEPEPPSPPMRSFRLAPPRRPTVARAYPVIDRDHPLFDRELDG